uniref:Uncharacterized protein n=1 Tax=Nothoprocta perdicaria TaxID=30464 RepID=A0A8C6YYF8_NOTPE
VNCKSPFGDQVKVPTGDGHPWLPLSQSVPRTVLSPHQLLGKCQPVGRVALVIEDDRIDEVLKGMTEKSPSGV